MPKTGTTSFEDAIFGKITVDNSELDDQILIKSDGLPTYNFANVVDDHLMGITHVVRGNEYLSSSPKYNLLYQAFGWEVPEYIHVSPIMKNSQTKLSKRNGDASFDDLMAKGYLKDAVINYIALLGWAPSSEREKFNLEELKHAFGISGLSKSPAIFDENKLLWLNGEYIRAKSQDEFYEDIKDILESAIKNKDIDLKLVASIIQPRVSLYSDIPEMVNFIDEAKEHSLDLYTHKKMKTTAETSAPVLKEIMNLFEKIDNWTYDNLHDSLIELAKTLELKNGQVMFPLRVCLSGKEFTPGGGVEIATILGKEETLKRIKEELIKF
jgi:glutamyl-tRNA synthetase